MYRTTTRILRALPPFCVGGGFGTRMLLDFGPPIGLQHQIEQYSIAWSFAFETLCFACMVLSFSYPCERTLQWLSTTQLVTGLWTFTLGLALIFGGNDYQAHGFEDWMASREWVSGGAAFGVATFFVYCWWDLYHFHIPEIRARERLRIHHNLPMPNEEI